MEEYLKKLFSRDKSMSMLKFRKMRSSWLNLGNFVAVNKDGKVKWADLVEVEEIKEEKKK